MIAVPPSSGSSSQLYLLAFVCTTAAGLVGICRMIQKAVTGEQSDRHFDASYGSHFVKQQQIDLSCAFRMVDLITFVIPVVLNKLIRVELIF